MERRGFLKIGGIAGGLIVVPDNLFGLENIVGKISDRIGKNSVEDAVVKIYNYPSNESVAEYITDSNGNYNLTATGVKYDLWKNVKILFDERQENKISIAKRASSNIIKAEITHPDYQDAVRYFNSLGDNFDTTIVPKSFDMTSFDSWTRTKSDGIQRWLKQPEVWKINVALAERQYVDLVKEIISEDIINAMGWSNPIIEEIRTANNVEEKGKYLVSWTTEDKDSYGNHHESLNGNEIISASVWFLPSNKERRIFLRQLTQSLGFVRNTSSYKFYTEKGYYTPEGLEMMTILNSMNLGNISPDTDPAPVL